LARAGRRHSYQPVQKVDSRFRFQFRGCADLPCCLSLPRRACVSNVVFRIWRGWTPNKLNVRNRPVALVAIEQQYVVLAAFRRTQCWKLVSRREKLRNEQLWRMKVGIQSLPKVALGAAPHNPIYVSRFGRPPPIFKSPINVNWLPSGIRTSLNNSANCARPDARKVFTRCLILRKQAADSFELVGESLDPALIASLHSSDKAVDALVTRIRDICVGVRRFGSGAPGYLGDKRCY
jgi:hypothetical protein